jgi:hypothetical protein
MKLIWIFQLGPGPIGTLLPFWFMFQFNSVPVTIFLPEKLPVVPRCSLSDLMFVVFSYLGVIWTPRSDCELRDHGKDSNADPDPNSWLNLLCIYLHQDPIRNADLFSHVIQENIRAERAVLPGALIICSPVIKKNI